MKMKPLAPIFQFHLARWAVTGIALAFAISEAITHARIKPQDRYFEVDSCGKKPSRLVTDKKDKVFEIERDTFAKFFIYHLTNFDEQTIEKTTLKAMDWVSPEIWKKEQPEMQKLIQDLRGNGLVQLAKAKVPASATGDYVATIEAEQYRRGKVKNLNGTIRFKVKPVDRMESSNEWGWQVVELDEQWNAKE